MISASATRSATSSFTDVKSVTRGLQADLFQVLDHYGYFSEQRARDIVHDLRLMIDEDILDHVELTWCVRGGTRVLEAYRYDVVRGSLVGANTRPGGIPYRPELANADFSVLVTYNAKGHGMSRQERQDLGFIRPWSPTGRRDYSGVSRTFERAYASNGLGLNRSVYR